ncbi:membrane-associated transporter protein-like [Saccoglossus kowalevskii]|uniref:Proton-associated sugar transporter A-like n=1 Tax=Saccoglossus kowalevskii TaxID=10224 RepID=A0ABM0GNB2_SACKO|nr:PREDICTED: proton-associated sugar transporter A-like [Saccoglossus kowalevskii]
MASPTISSSPSSHSRPIPSRRLSNVVSPHGTYNTSYGSYSSSLTMSMKGPYLRPRRISARQEEHGGDTPDIYRRRTGRHSSIRTSFSHPPHDITPIEKVPSHVTYEQFTPHEPPHRSFWKLVCLSAIVFGTQYCFATETALATPILLKIGLPKQLYSLNWFIGPVLGLIFQPLLGSLSDRCRCNWGRRRPFILALCIGVLIGLTLVLNGAVIGKLVEHSDTYTTWSIVFTIIGVVILDFSADSVDCPHRAYIVDSCNADDIERGMNIRALLTGLGGGLGYIMGGIDWDSTFFGGWFGYNAHIRVVYIFNMVVCVITFTLTLFSVKEIPLSQVLSQHLDNNMTDDERPLLSGGDPGNIQDGGCIRPYGSFSNGEISKQTGDHSKQSNRDHASMISTPFEDKLIQDEPFTDTSILTLLKSIVKMPRELFILCCNHFLSEIAYLTVLLFFTDYMAQQVYKGDPNAPEGSPEHQAYDDGVKMGCWGMCIFAFSAAIYSVILDRLIGRLSLRTLYVGGELIFAVGTGLQAIFHNSVAATLVLCSTFGVMYTTIATLPFIILARFHESEDYVNRGRVQRGLATDTACLQCQLFLAQIILSAILGPISNAAGTHLVTVLTASAAAFCAAFFSALFVVYEINPKPSEHSQSVQG